MRCWYFKLLLTAGGLICLVVIAFVHLNSTRPAIVSVCSQKADKHETTSLPFQDLHSTKAEITLHDSLNVISLDEIVKGPLQQNDKRILNFIFNNGYLLPPTPSYVPYNLKKPAIDPSMGQSNVVKNIFGEMRDGFFVECGALDGETRSNTLTLEKDYGWKGLLIEGDPSNYNLVLQKKRKAWTAGCCLAIHPYPHEVIFQQNFNTGRIKPDNRKNIIKPNGQNGTKTTKQKLLTTYKVAKEVIVQCFPLFSLLSALNVSTVDYFSLDVEGDELAVLETIPFNLISIKVISVEFLHGKGGTKALEDFMETKDYTVVAQVTHPHNLANDLIFVHNSVETNTDLFVDRRDYETES